MECPKYIEALLIYLDEEIARLYWNSHQEVWDSPLENIGAWFKNDTFAMHSYEWADEPKYDWNFKCGDIEISWYKHLGRCTTINKMVTPDEAVEMFNKCLASLGNEYHNEEDK